MDAFELTSTVYEGWVIVSHTQVVQYIYKVSYNHEFIHICKYIIN